MSAIKYPLLLASITLIWGLGGWLTSPPAALFAARPPAWVQAQTPDTGEPSLVGSLHFVDNDAAPTGSFVLEINPIDALPAGSHYELWLSSDQEDSLLNLGTLKVSNRRATLRADTDQALLATFNRALISIEPDTDQDEVISQQIVLSSTLPVSLTSPLRQLFFASERNDKGFLTGAVEQVQIVVQHTGFLNDALAADDFAEARRHAEHVVNILEGEGGFTYGDLNRDGQAQNPGDGFGLLVYLREAEGLVGDGLGALDATIVPQAQLDQGEPMATMLATDHTIVAEAVEKTVKVFASDTVTEAQGFADELRVMVGEVANDLTNIYTTTQQWAEYRFYAQPNPSAATNTPTFTATKLPTLTATNTATPRTINTATPTAISSPTPTVDTVTHRHYDELINANRDESVNGHRDQFTHANCDACPHCHRDKLAHANCYQLAHAQRNQYKHEDTDCYPDGHRHINTVANCNANRDASNRSNCATCFAREPDRGRHVDESG